MTLNKKDLLFLFALLLSIFMFYPELFLAKAASLIGDHWEQHYPWAFLMAEHVKNWNLPFWTLLIHCGFPIAAEGQIGIFYLPNIFLYLLLPVQWAYSYVNVFHFLVAAWGTYLYGREIKLSPEASFISAFIFTLGTAYGGAYYNITSLKTIAWFPICLFLFEKYLHNKKFINLFILAIVLSQLLVAGYLQVAILLLLIFSFYILLRVFFFSEAKRNSIQCIKVLAMFALTVSLAALLAFPQLVLTFELALRSNRVGLTEDYAYIGSMSPLAIATFLIAIIQGLCRGNSIYGGVFSILLILFAICSKNVRQNKMFKLWLWIAAFSLLLALGRWSPLYVALIKVTHFYSFRTPMKFLVFTCFALAMLSGFGFDEALKGRTKSNPELNSRVIQSYLGLVFFFAAALAAIYLGLTVLRPDTVRFGEFIIQKFVYGHIGRPHSLEEYIQKLNAFLDIFLSIYSVHYFWAVWTLIVIALSILLVLFLKHESKFRSAWLTFGFIFLFADLYTFSWFDIKKDFNHYQNLTDSSLVIQKLKEEKNSGRLERLYGFRKLEDELPLVPSVNILYGIEDIGAYSPFILKRYYESIGTFGNVNDSNAAFSPARDYVLDRLELLSALGVSHILSKVPLENSSLKLIVHDQTSECYLYVNNQEHLKAFFTRKVEQFTNWEGLKNRFLTTGFNPKEILLLEQSEIQKVNWNLASSTGKGRATIEHHKQESEYDVWEIETKMPGFFIVMDSMYPGWTATVNGKKTQILYGYGLFKTIWLEEPGKYEIVFRYAPFDRRSSENRL